MTLSEDIQRELDRAQRALAEGNDGMARVCARRAVGAAIREWAAQGSRPPEWANARNAVTQLRALAAADSFPRSVRDSAARLSTTVDRDHKLPFTQSPLDDAALIIRHFLR
ncbi:MAG: hypothetical protein FJ030_01520 [Chloroflexi bacterium]|nr:hypothetical protein [Chloroflexota bacterium]